ncbi:MAG TPA: heparinase II/III family protein [Tepidisphaeraceae bacterium]|nr:heparinase II/III family protein [Tepidisphaeraceae bacterium]
MRIVSLVMGAVLLMVGPLASAATTSVFFPQELMQRVRKNARHDARASQLRERAIEIAKPWKEMSDDQIWKLMFSATLPRSWMVWSNGVCPDCGKPVPMYEWKIDALAHPWKVQCPHCGALFPTNDFKKFYDSGLDSHGIFDPAKADRSLLYNTAHPDPKDPLHMFGVDDGTGYVKGKDRWRFIPTYLVFGQWQQAVHRGILVLATAYELTGDPIYAHKAAILLNRVADVFPAFDFKKQGVLYETIHSNGYVSYWCNSAIEVRQMAFAYDAIKPAIFSDPGLVSFLSEKSEQYHPPIAIHTGADIANNIETRIFKDALAHPEKIYSNFPEQFLTEAVIDTVLNWPANREKVLAMLDPVIATSTKVDGVTGEKGLSGYSCYAAQQMAEFLAYYARADKTFLPEMIRRHPQLPQMWRFFIDTWCDNQQYYPLIGDCGYFAQRIPTYYGVVFHNDNGLGAHALDQSAGVLAPSMYSFLWQLYKTTNDPAFAQAIYDQNDKKLDGLPYDVFCTDPQAMRQELKSVINKNGSEIKLGDVNKQQWHLAILRSGKSDNSRAVWLKYDAGGGHGHMDGLTLGLFAKGLDLMPDFGYPPVQYGGWTSERALWYKSTAAHNTVLINNNDQVASDLRPDGNGMMIPWAEGKTTLWADGDGFSAITASAPEVYPKIAKKYDRTVALIDISPADFYVLDIFRMAGGHEHDKFFLSHFGTITTSLPMKPATDYSHPLMRDFKVARDPKPGWSVTWKVEDHYHYLPEGSDVRVRYTDFTHNIDAYTCQAWVVSGLYNSNEQVWVPRVMVRHTGGEGLETNYVNLIEPFDGKTGAAVKDASRLMLKQGDHDAGDSSVALHVNLADGRNDLLISDDSDAAVVQPDEKVTTDAKLAMLRRDSAGLPQMLSFCNGTEFDTDDLKLHTAPGVFVQISFGSNGAKLIRGNAKDITLLELGGKRIAF